MTEPVIPTFDENGYLNGRIQAWIESQRASHQDVFGRARELNRDCHHFLDSRSVDVGNIKQVATSVLFARLLELYQSVIIVSERGMAATTRILSRAFLEASFHFLAIQRDPTYLEDYLNQDLIQTKKLIKRIRRSTSAEFEMQKLRQGATDRVLEEVEKAIIERKAREIPIEDVAKRSGSHDSYVTAYAILSHAVHTGASDVDHHIRVNDVTKEIDGFTYGPSESETLRAICLSGMALTEALELVSQNFGEDRNALCEAHNKAFQSFLEKS